MEYSEAAQFSIRSMLQASSASSSLGLDSLTGRGIALSKENRNIIRVRQTRGT